MNHCEVLGSGGNERNTPGWSTPSRRGCRAPAPNDAVWEYGVATDNFSIFFKRICDCLLKYLDGKDPDAGQDWRKKERVDGITDSMDMNWSKLWETAEDGGAWCTAVRGVTKSRTQLSTDDNKMMVALKKYQIILTSDSSQCWLVVLCFLLQFFF